MEWFESQTSVWDIWSTRVIQARHDQSCLWSDSNLNQVFSIKWFESQTNGSSTRGRQTIWSRPSLCSSSLTRGFVGRLSLATAPSLRSKGATPSVRRQGEASTTSWPTSTSSRGSRLTDMEINPRESMERITLMIKIKSKENSFLNSWFESLHKRFDQYHLSDSTCKF